MAKTSAGLLLYRFRGGVAQVLLVHPGGPFWKHKDAGVWSVPKGEIEAGEDPLAAARREFAEELGSAAPTGPQVELTPVKQKGGKTVLAWAVAGDLDVSTVRSNTVTIPWPPRSGRTIEVPEVDRADWFDLTTAATKVIAGQQPLLAELATVLSA